MIARILDGSESTSTFRTALNTLFWFTQPNTLQLPIGATGDNNLFVIPAFDVIDNSSSYNWCSLIGSKLLGATKRFSLNVCRTFCGEDFAVLSENSFNKIELKSAVFKEQILSKKSCISIFCNILLQILSMKISPFFTNFIHENLSFFQYSKSEKFYRGQLTRHYKYGTLFWSFVISLIKNVLLLYEIIPSLSQVLIALFKLRMGVLISFDKFAFVRFCKVPRR